MYNQESESEFMNKFFDKFTEGFYKHMAEIDHDDQLNITNLLIEYVDILLEYYEGVGDLEYPKYNEVLKDKADKFLSKNIYEAYPAQVRQMRLEGFFSYFNSDSHPLVQEVYEEKKVKLSSSPQRYKRSIFKNILKGLKGFLKHYRDQLTLTPELVKSDGGKNFSKNLNKMLLKADKREKKWKENKSGIKPINIAVVFHLLRKRFFDDQDLDNYEIGVLAKLIAGVSNNTVQNSLPKTYQKENDWFADNYYHKKHIKNLELVRDTFNEITTELNEVITNYYKK